MTVGDEIAFGMENRCLEREEIQRRSDEAMELLAISHLRDRELATLSGGEQQRVAVASIVAGRPEALVLDEPTASLDPEASRDLFRALADLSRRTGLTVAIIEHKLAHLLPLKPRLICLKGGRVEEGCEPSAISHQPSADGRARRGGQSGDRHRPTIRTSEGTSPAVGATDPGPDVLPIAEMSGMTVELGGQTVLDGVSFRVHPGEVVAVLGPNGGGKTTLLHCLLGLVKPAGGSIEVCGLVVGETPISRLARDVGLVFQNADHQLVTDTVWSEALFAARSLKMLDRASEQEAERFLQGAGLSSRKDDHPYRLSWGQKRRLNVISAILHGPRLLLLDEPFAGQDWENAVFLLEAIGGVVGGASDVPRAENRRAQRGACLMVTHDPRIVLRSCTRVLFVVGGRVTVDSPVPEAFDQLRELGHDAYVPA
jgi:energy-coupling factor transport system ATP-binding protein